MTTNNRTKRRSRVREAFIFLGAALVLGAFIVKDAIREHFKDLNDAIDIAQSRYLITQSNVEAQINLNIVEGELAGLLTHEERKCSKEPSVAGYLNLFTRVVESSWNLVAKFPDTLEKFKLADKMADVKRQLAAEHINATEIAEFEEDTLKLATKQKEAIEHRYDIFTDVSYGLYCAIVVFSVIAKLKGIDLAGGE